MELRDYLRILRAHWLGILLLTALGIAVAFGWSLLQPKVYTASATGYVQPTKNDNEQATTGTSVIGDQLAKSKVKSFIAIGEWRSVADRVISDLGLDTSPESLVGRVTVSNPTDTVIIEVTARGDTPEGARDLAEAWVRALAGEIDEIDGDGTPGSASISITPGDSAALPSAPSSPNVRLSLVLGGLIGLALGIAYAVTRHILDRRVRNPAEIERQTGASVVGTLPLEKSLTGHRVPLDFDARKRSSTVFLAEAMRELRSNLRFMDVDNPPRVIVVTSPIPGDGKSTVSTNLAISLAESGQKVSLLDGDLRRPVIGDIFHLPEGAGLTDVLAGEATVEDVAHRPHPSGNLLVLPAGRTPPNPSEVLGSHRMHELLIDLAREGMVIIDAPPVIPVTDAAVLAHSADGAVIVVSAGRTTYDMLAKALGNMAKTNARVLGIVLNKVPRRGADSSYYGYQYHGEYYATTEDLRESEFAADMSGADSAVPPMTLDVNVAESPRRAARRSATRN